jgi:endoglucanase
VVDWITDAGMYCAVNIHWDGGWIDSSQREKVSQDVSHLQRRSCEKYKSYWTQIATFFQGKNEKLIFEGFNEEYSFQSEAKPYEALARVNQLFVDTVRATGGNNATRLLIIPGYNTGHRQDVQPRVPPAEGHVPESCSSRPLLHAVAVCRAERRRELGEDVAHLGSEADVKQLNELFDRMSEFAPATTSRSTS